MAKRGNGGKLFAISPVCSPFSDESRAAGAFEEPDQATQVYEGDDGKIGCEGLPRRMSFQTSGFQFFFVSMKNNNSRLSMMVLLSMLLHLSTENSKINPPMGISPQVENHCSKQMRLSCR